MKAMFGKRLKEIRKVRRLTQQDLTTKLGTTKTTVSGWETSCYLPPVSKLIEICNVLDTSSNYLLELADLQTLNVDGLNVEAVNHLQTIADFFKEMKRYK